MDLEKENQMLRAEVLQRREKIENYLEDGLLEIDNNLIENAIRPCQGGRVGSA